MNQMVDDLIPPPLVRDLPKSGCRAHTIGEILREKGAMESSRYEWFKEHVRQMAILYLSSPHTVHKMQPSQEWEVFSSKMTAEYPELARFHERWPLILYFDQWVCSVKKVNPQLRRSRSSLSTSRPRKETSLLYLLLQPLTGAELQRLCQPNGFLFRLLLKRYEQVCQYVGKPPPKRHFRSLHLVDASPVRERTAEERRRKSGHRGPDASKRPHTPAPCEGLAQEWLPCTRYWRSSRSKGWYGE
ncbi:hypothetical protein L218DRAFT_650662 [Marasmius fiardii PR-910]|nr:hypothetical protein L218DRAFT_650662 [Marasmius fiardii PR-910]